MGPSSPLDAPLAEAEVVSLETLLGTRTDIRRGDVSSALVEVVPSGFAALDDALRGGWPVGAVTELLIERTGIGELSLVLPALRTATAERGGWAALVGAPFMPYAPALRNAGLALERLLLIETDRDDDTLWAAERLLRSGGVDVVLAWARRTTPAKPRRLQLAAERGGAIGIVYRAASDAGDHSPVALRLTLAVTDGAFAIDVRKNRAGALGRVTLAPSAFDAAQGVEWPVPPAAPTSSVTPLFGRA